MLCVHLPAPLVHLLSSLTSYSAEGVYGTQSASLYCIKISNVQIDADVLRKSSRYVTLTPIRIYSLYTLQCSIYRVLIKQSYAQYIFRVLCLG